MRRTQSQSRNLFLTGIDRLAGPAAEQADLEALREVRILSAAYVVALGLVAFLLAANLREGTPFISWVAAATLPLLLGGVYGLRSGRTRVAGQLLCGVSFSFAGGVTAATGAADPSVLFFGALVPVVAALVLDWRAALLWAGATALLQLSVAGLAAQGFAFPIVVAPDLVAATRFRSALAFLIAALAAVVTSERVRSLALRESRARGQLHRSLFESAPLGVFILDLEGSVRDANPEAVRLLGAPSREAVVGISLFSREDVEGGFEFDQMRETLAGGPPISGELRWRSVFGTEVEARGFLVPLLDGDGQPAGGQIILEDLRGTRAAAEALRASEARYRAIVENSTDVLAEVDAHGVVLFVSGNAEQVTGFPTDILTGVRPVDRVHPDDARRLARAIRSVARGEAIHIDSHRYQRADGSWMWQELSARPFRTASGETHFLVTARDVTERIEAERHLRQAQKMEAMGQLAGGVAHDFNNLLTVITGWSDELREGGMAAESVQAAGREILTAAERGAALTRQLLAFSRERPYEPEILDASEAVASVGKLLGRLIPERIRLELELGEGLPPVRADRGMLEQSLMNLVLNARDALEAGGTIRVRTGWRKNAERDEVTLAVIDDGIGMSPEVAERVFEPFFTTKPVGAGTGLGLAVVYAAAQRMEGEVEIESRLGHGTTATLRLPAAESAPEVRADGEGSSPASGGSETLLVAEDDPLVRRIVVTTLEAQGYRVLAAKDGEEALGIALHHEGPIHLLLTDVVMPRMSGPKLAQALRRRWPSLPLLFMSGYPKGLEDAEGESLLHKPFTPSALRARVREVLDQGES